MDRDFAGSTYRSSFFEDRKDGFCGLELVRAYKGTTQRVAAVTFWDAYGQFFLETFNSDVPLEVVEELFSETKERVTR